MAKKRKKQKEEESYEFKMPEFDEEEYLKKEVRDSKTLFVTFIYGVVIAFVSFGLSFMEPALGALVGFIAVIFIRHLYPLIGVDTSRLEKKQWATNIIFYIFTWLLVWIILTNPPFSDFQEPTIKSDGIYFGSPGNWTRLDLGKNGNAENLTYNMNVSINVTIIDNVGIDTSSISITITNKDGETLGSMANNGENKYVYVLDLSSQGLHKFKITASDTNGLESTYTDSFYVR